MLENITPPRLQTPDEIAMARAFLDCAGIKTTLDTSTKPPTLIADDPENEPLALVEVVTMSQALSMTEKALGHGGKR
tara:strand:+ start:1841 stop:2071 length:231 start_codon:yes stop_codon:yes gene_type:complete